MADKTGIEWTDATWNPVTGCTKVSPGCDHCYAETFSERFRDTPGHYFENGFNLQLRPDKFDQPLRWTRPRRIFVNSMSDLFHDGIPNEYIARVFAVMAMAEQHTFQVLTKRHARMRSLLSSDDFQSEVAHHLLALTVPDKDDLPSQVVDVLDWWPLRNVWLGVSTEDQKWADIRIPALLSTPAAVRFISAEPLLGPVDARFSHCPTHDFAGGMCTWSCPERYGLDWVIVGGESGRGARPMHPDWVRTLRDQCTTTGVAFHFKQWGEWAPIGPDAVTANATVFLGADGKGTYYAHRHRGDVATLARVGKKAAGRELDGRTWNEYPEASS